ncbi:MAG: LpxL/LpxP family Kdo(2)-lipid IV(A) lauroyl/palmitoleoyl acyltransferase [Neptuniibacter sp.]
MNLNKEFYYPKYWPTWFGIALLRLIATLPFKAGLSLGRAIGFILYYLISKRRRVTEANIKHCFPELTEEEQAQFVKDVFLNNGIGVIETAWAYWGNRKKLKQRTEFLGFNLIDDALKENRGIILLGAHYSHLDLGGLLFSFHGAPLVSMYREHNNPLMEKIIFSGRDNFSTPIERKKLRELVRLLKKNQVVWYGPDQDLGRKNSVFVPFFGKTAATVTATTKMVRFNNSPILALYQRRKEDDSGYIVEIAEVEGFPSGDELEDAEIMNRAIEAGVRKAPTQYMWVHKRFKTQPESDQALYKANNC